MDERLDDPAARNERSGDPNEFLAGFVTGALVGGALAILLTPQSGEDLRHMLRATWRRASNRARDFSADVSGHAQESP